MCPPLGSAADETSEIPPLQDAHLTDFILQGQITQAAYAHARDQLHPDILAHSLRVYMYATALSHNEATGWTTPGRLPLLFTACLFHDIGTAEIHDTEPVRFEIEGANAARDFLTQRGVSPEDGHEVWVAIAVHTTPHIAERISTLARLVRLGVLADFKRPTVLSMLKGGAIEEAERCCPRGEIEQALSDAVIRQAVKQPEKAPRHCWPGDLYLARMADPEWMGI